MHISLLEEDLQDSIKRNKTINSKKYVYANQNDWISLHLQCYKYYAMIFNIMMLCGHYYLESRDCMIILNNIMLWSNEKMSWHILYRINWNQVQHIPKKQLVVLLRVVIHPTIKFKLIHEETMSLTGLRTTR